MLRQEGFYVRIEASAPGKGSRQGKSGYDTGSPPEPRTMHEARMNVQGSGWQVLAPLGIARTAPNALHPRDFYLTAGRNEVRL